MWIGVGYGVNPIVLRYFHRLFHCEEAHHIEILKEIFVQLPVALIISSLFSFDAALEFANVIITLNVSVRNFLKVICGFLSNDSIAL